MQRHVAVAAVGFAICSACATSKPSLRLEPGAHVSWQKPIALEPVSVRADAPESAPVASALTEMLHAQLQDVGVPIAAPGEAELTLKPELVLYVGPPPAGVRAANVAAAIVLLPLGWLYIPDFGATCLLWLHLVDKSGALVGEELISAHNRQPLESCAARATAAIAGTPQSSGELSSPSPQPVEPVFVGRKPSLRIGAASGFSTFSGAAGLLGEAEMQRRLRDALLPTGLFSQVWSPSVPHDADYELSAELVRELYPDSTRYALVLIRYRIKSVATGRQIFAETVLSEADRPNEAQEANIRSLVTKLAGALSPRTTTTPEPPGR